MTWLLIVAATAIGAGTAVALRWPVVGLLVYLWLDFMRMTDMFVETRYRPMLVIGSRRRRRASGGNGRACAKVGARCCRSPPSWRSSPPAC